MYLNLSNLVIKLNLSNLVINTNAILSLIMHVTCYSSHIATFVQLLVSQLCSSTN